MLFVTNRIPKEGYETKLNRQFTFDLDNNSPSNSVFYCEKAGNGCTEIGSEAFLRSLKTSEYKELLFYIHGFSNMPADVFKAAEEFQFLCDKAEPNRVLVVPIIWPCDNDLGIVKDYWDDQRSADASAMSFSRVLEKFIDWRNCQKSNPKEDQCYKRMHVLAHSMGNRVYRETLANWKKYGLSGNVPEIFKNSFLVASDIVNESLHRGEDGELISDASGNVIVYFASDDFALRASKAANLRNRIASRRLGHKGPENMNLLPENVYAVDCGDFNNVYDKPKGHTYFRSGTTKGEPGKVFNHIFGAIASGRSEGHSSEKKKIVLK